MVMADSSPCFCNSASPPFFSLLGIIHNLPLSYAMFATIICRHANSHFDDDQLQRDMALAHQMAIAESSTDALVVILLCFFFSLSHFVLIIVAADH